MPDSSVRGDSCKNEALGVYNDFYNETGYVAAALEIACLHRNKSSSCIYAKVSPCACWKMSQPHLLL